RIDARKLDDDVQRRRIVGAEAVALRTEASAHAREARHLPEVREELLDLALEIVEVAPSPGHHLGCTRFAVRSKHGPYPATRRRCGRFTALHLDWRCSQPAAGQGEEARASTA